MFSDALKAALEQEVVGQQAAVSSVVRGTTRVMSGLMPAERSWCAYMFMGPSGTGKTQLVRTLAKMIHGERQDPFVADCTHFVHSDPWTAFVAQIAPMFTLPLPQDGGMTLEAPPFSILLVEYLERGRKEISKALTAALDTGRLALPGGRQGSLRNVLVFITTSLCSREILEENPRIGFQGSVGTPAEEDRISRTCRTQAEEHFGEDLISRLDALVVFHRLQNPELALILDRRFARMSRWLAERDVHCALGPGAQAFILERGQSDAKLGARELVRVFRRFVEFPMADLLISRRIPPGGKVAIDHEPPAEHLSFTVSREVMAAVPGSSGSREIGVSWGSQAAAL